MGSNRRGPADGDRGALSRVGDLATPVEDRQTGLRGARRRDDGVGLAHGGRVGRLAVAGIAVLGAVACAPSGDEKAEKDWIPDTEIFLVEANGDDSGPMFSEPVNITTPAMPRNWATLA